MDAMGVVLGYALGSSNSSGDKNDKFGNTKVLYELPRLAERVRDPLAIGIVSTGGNDRCHNLREEFVSLMRNHSDLEILQVVQVINNQHYLYLQFIFTEKTNLFPSEELPAK